MKRVKLFKVVIEDLMVAEHAEFLETMNMPMLDASMVRDSGEMACSAVGNKITMPIRKHMRRTKLSRRQLELCGRECWFEHPEEGYATEETYIAIDPAAERVLRVELDRIENLEVLNSRLKVLIVEREQRLDFFQDAGFFLRLKRLFTGVQDE